MPKESIVRRLPKATCYIRGCRNKAAVWVQRWEGAPETGHWLEAKVCAGHSSEYKKAKNQNG